MNPSPYVRVQAGGTAILVCVALIVLGDRLAGVLAGMLGVSLLVWAVLIARHRWAIRQRVTSPYRRTGNKAMTYCLVGGVLLPGGAAVAVLLHGAGAAGAMLGSVEASLIAASLVLVMLAVLTSSAVDWYFIRPFRDGVVGEPACRLVSSEPRRVEAYAKWWILHRGAAELLGFGGASVAVAVTLVAVSVEVDNETAAETMRYLGVPAALYLIGQQLVSRLAPAWRYVLAPSPGLGAFVSGRRADGSPVEGFLVDVSIYPGIQLLEAPDSLAGYVPLRHASSLKRLPRVACERQCEHWLPECEVGFGEDADSAERAETGDAPPVLDAGGHAGSPS